MGRGVGNDGVGENIVGDIGGRGWSCLVGVGVGVVIVIVIAQDGKMVGRVMGGGGWCAVCVIIVQGGDAVGWVKGGGGCGDVGGGGCCDWGSGNGVSVVGGVYAGWMVRVCVVWQAKTKEQSLVRRVSRVGWSVDGYCSSGRAGKWLDVGRRWLGVNGVSLCVCVCVSWSLAKRAVCCKACNTNL